MSLSLILDFATPNVKIGMVNDKQNSEIIFKMGKGTTSRIYQSINFLLDSFKKDIDDIDEIILNQGPGSFTGIRVAFAFASGFITNKKTTLIPLPFHEVLAFKYALLHSSSSKLKIAVVLNGLRDELFVQSFKFDNGVFTEKSSLKIISINEIDIFLKDTDIKIVESIKKLPYKKYYHLPALDIIDFYNYSINLPEEYKFTFEPIYLRKSAAREKKEKK